MTIRHFLREKSIFQTGTTSSFTRPPSSEAVQEAATRNVTASAILQRNDGVRQGKCSNQPLLAKQAGATSVVTVNPILEARVNTPRLHARHASLVTPPQNAPWKVTISETLSLPLNVQGHICMARTVSLSGQRLRESHRFVRNVDLYRKYPLPHAEIASARYRCNHYDSGSQQLSRFEYFFIF